MYNINGDNPENFVCLKLDMIVTYLFVTGVLRLRFLIMSNIYFMTLKIPSVKTDTIRDLRIQQP